MFGPDCTMKVAGEVARNLSCVKVRRARRNP